MARDVELRHVTRIDGPEVRSVKVVVVDLLLLEEPTLEDTRGREFTLCAHDDISDAHLIQLVLGSLEVGSCLFGLSRQLGDTP